LVKQIVNNSHNTGYGTYSSYFLNRDIRDFRDTRDKELYLKNLKFKDEYVLIVLEF
jgi:hypothetical protein